MDFTETVISHCFVVVTLTVMARTYSSGQQAFLYGNSTHSELTFK